jgi:kynureninase
LPALRKKSLNLTGTMRQLIEARLPQDIDIITPASADRSGCQLSLKLKRNAAEAKRSQQRLEAAGVIADWREPDIMRVAPAPFYNSYSDVFAAVEQLEAVLRA